MIIESVGDFQQLQSQLHGLDLAQKTMEFSGPGEWLGIMLTIIFFLVFLFYLTEVVRRRTPIYTPFAYLVLIALWWGFAFSPVVNVELGDNLGDANLSSEQAKLRLRVSSLQTKIASMQSIDPRPATKLAQTKQRLKFVDGLIAQQNKPVAKTSLLIALCYTSAKVFYLGAQAVIDAVSYRRGTDRQYQAQLMRSMADAPFLTPDERTIGQQLSNCLLAKQMLVRRTGQHARRIAALNQLRKNPKVNKAQIADAASQIDFEQNQVRQQCNQMSKRLMSSIDKAISPADVQNFETAYTYNILGVDVGKHKVSNQERRDFLLAQAGLSLSQVKGMSSTNLAKTFLRYKHLVALSDAWQKGAFDDRFEDTGKTSQKGFKASLGGGFMDWMSGWLLSIKPIIKLVLNFSWMAVLWSGAVAGVLSLLPTWHFKAPIYLFLAITFLGLWQVTNNLIEGWAAHLSAKNVAAQKMPNDYMSRLALDTYDSLVGGYEGDALAAGAAGVKPAMASKQMIVKALSKVSTRAKIGGAAGLLVAGATQVGLSAYGASLRIKKESDAYNRLIAVQAGGLNPGLDGIFSGFLQAQQSSIRAAARHGQTLEALLLLAAPLLVGVIFFGGGHRLLGGLSSSTAGQAAMGMGNSVGGAGLGRIMGGGGRMGGK